MKTDVKQKKHVKRMLALLLALALLMLGCGCGTEAPAEAAAASAASAEAQESSGTWGGELPAAESSQTVAPAPTAAPEAPASAREEPSLSEPESVLETEPLQEPVPTPDPNLVGEAFVTDPNVEEQLAAMSLEEKVAQLFIITPNALVNQDINVIAAGSTTAEAYDKAPVGGLIYMEENLVDPEQTREMLSRMAIIGRERTGLMPFLCVDEEGGTVARIGGSGNFGVPEYPDMSELAAEGDTEKLRTVGSEIGAYLKDLGFNVDFAPVADVLVNPENEVVKYRAFGSDPVQVAAMAAAFTEGLQSQGVLGCYKHFPGHGNTAGDTHDGFTAAASTPDQLRERELVPFRDGIADGISWIMVGHISLPNVIGDDTPASLSSVVVTDMLRGELGYQGLVVTDALNMGAIADNYTSAESAVMALQAGVDVLLMPMDYTAAYDAVLAAVADGTLTEARIDESIRRILTVKNTLQ